jgi:hypothetical protein
MTTAPLLSCNANHVLLPVSGLSLVPPVLLEQTTLPLQKKSKIWLVVWFTRNTLIWWIKTLLSSLLLYKGPQGIGNCLWLFGLVFIFPGQQQITGSIQFWELFEVSPDGYRPVLVHFESGFFNASASILWPWAHRHKFGTHSLSAKQFQVHTW